MVEGVTVVGFILGVITGLLVAVMLLMWVVIGAGADFPDEWDDVFLNEEDDQ